MTTSIRTPSVDGHATLTNALAMNALLAVQTAIDERTPEALYDALMALGYLGEVLQAWHAEVTP
jgi:hypothetical protein